MQSSLGGQNLMRRRCQNCGAYLDPGEICDCEKEEAAPDVEDPKAADEYKFVNSITPEN